MSNYNLIAPLYDLLATLVFAGQTHKANRQFFSDIPDGSRILVLGGGTGQLLPQLKPECRVVFIEPSSKMLARAKKRKHPVSTSFLQHKFEDFDYDEKFDFVICQFFLDLFDDETMARHLTRIKSTLTDKGVLLISDFHIPKKPFKWLKMSLLKLKKPNLTLVLRVAKNLIKA